MKSELFEAERAPLVKVKGLITRLINRLQTEMSHVSYCDEETSMAAEKKEDLEADIAKHSSHLKQPCPDPPRRTLSLSTKLTLTKSATRSPTW